MLFTVVSASLTTLHDMITPDREGQKVDLAYPILLEILTSSCIPGPAVHPGAADNKADELAGYGDQAMNVANGLGDEVSVLGLSGGGLWACWTWASGPMLVAANHVLGTYPRRPIIP